MLAIASILISGTAAVLHSKLDAPQLRYWADAEIPPDAAAIPGNGEGFLPPNTVPGAGLAQFPVSDGETGGVRPPDVNFDHTPISDGESEGIMPPDVNFDHTPISDGESEGIMPPDINFDHTPISDGESEGIMPPDINFDHTPISDGESEGIILPDVDSDQTPGSKGGEDPGDAPGQAPGETPEETPEEPGPGDLIGSLVPNDALICYQAARHHMEVMLFRFRKSKYGRMYTHAEVSGQSCEDRGYLINIGQTCFGNTFSKDWDMGEHMRNEEAVAKEALRLKGGDKQPDWWRVHCIDCSGHC